MSRDPWVQRFDEEADEDERYYRTLARERMDRAREKASLDAPPALSAVPDPEPFPEGEAWCSPSHGRTTIASMEGTIAAGLARHDGPPPPPPPGPLEPPRIPARRYVCVPLWRQLLRWLGWTAALLAAWALALAVALAIFMGVAWGLSGP